MTTINKTTTINTPHAAVLIFNYLDRIPEDYSNVSDIDKTYPNIISTLSCVSIQTSKSKSDPQGSFNLVLAPTKNWVAQLTPGSWCVLMMSQEPIVAKDFQKANAKLVKMVGKIDSVRVDTQVQDDGSRKSLYYVTGIDWGHIMHSILYIDPLINDTTGTDAGQGSAIFVAIRDAMMNKGGTPSTFLVKDNLSSLLQLFGTSLGGLTEAGNDINRLASSIYTFRIPDAMVNFFNFVGPQGQHVKNNEINKFITLRTGSLVAKDSYIDYGEAAGFINPFTFQGANSIWQILLDNSNPALNEMYCEMVWGKGSNKDPNSLQFVIHNRIRPFAFKQFNPKAGSPGRLKSYFQYIAQHNIDSNTVLSVNAGTNWADKYNFIEIKPDFQDFAIFGNWVKQKSQISDQAAFSREGFRPLIVNTKQFPRNTKQKTGDTSLNADIDWSQLEVWVALMKDWYFDTHRMLNGSITFTGTTEYIAVGNNIKFDVQLVNPTQNMTKLQNTATIQDGYFILGHIESISNSFTVNDSGARSYITTVQFVRGIVVNSKNVAYGDGTLDALSSAMTINTLKNTTNTLSTSDSQDPDPQKVRGN